MSQFPIASGRRIVAAVFVGTFLATVPLQVVHAEQGAKSTQTMMDHGKRATERTETRISELHAKLNITPAQESLWNTVAQTMRDNTTALRTTMTDRSTRLNRMTAVDDLRSFQIIADQHAEGLRRLTPAFEALYAGMTPEQQKNADRVFGEHQRHAHHDRM